MRSISPGDILSIIKSTRRSWYDYIFNIRLQAIKLTIAVPSDYSGDLSVETSNGSIDISDIKASSIHLENIKRPDQREKHGCLDQP